MAARPWLKEVEAPSRRSAPLMFEGKEKRDTAWPAPPRTGPAERWLFDNRIGTTFGGVKAAKVATAPD